jgi:hypothetical protein
MTAWLLLSILLTQSFSPVASGTITGMVRLPDGTPANGVRVAAMVARDATRKPGGASELAAIAIAGESGRYRLENVPAGRYYIMAGRVDSPNYYPAGRILGEATVLSVTAGAVLADIDFVTARPPLPRGPAMLAPGRVVIDPNSSDKQNPAWLTFGRGAIGGDPPLLRTRSTIAPDGTFSVNVPSGELMLSVPQLPEGYLLKSLTSGEVDLLKQPLIIAPGMPEIVVVVTTDARPRFSVSGRVVGAANRNLWTEFVDIELLGDSGSIARIAPDAQGQFLFRRLLPGEYRLRMNSLEPAAPEKRITVTDRDVTAIEFLAPAPRPRP